VAFSNSTQAKKKCKTRAAGAYEIILITYPRLVMRHCAVGYLPGPLPWPLPNDAFVRIYGLGKMCREVRAIRGLYYGAGWHRGQVPCRTTSQ
jgi:hypothetical protein